MKKITLLVALIVGLYGLEAQTVDKFTETMTKTLKDMDTVKTADGMMGFANKFERIALAEKTQWLPYYYSALCRTTASYMYNDATKFDAILDVAEKHLNIADSLSPTNSEILVVKSMILGGRIMVDPMSRGQLYGMQSMMMLQKAMATDPTNPRAYYIMGQSLFYTPPQFGGGQESGCAMTQTAKELYASFKPKSPIHPNWGEDQVDELLKQCPSTSTDTETKTPENE